MQFMHTVSRVLLCLWMAGASAAGHAQSASTPFSTPGQFAVSPSGAATYRIPIEVPPGVAGMAPKLELVYNSQGGNGLLGMGWSLSGLSAISRCPRTMASDGARGAVNFDANDRFCLDGQRLILVSGTYGAAGSEYRTELESFSQITAVGSAGSGPASFVVKTKGGLTMEYGNTADSRIEAVKAAGSLAAWPTGSVHTWAQNKITDVKGNYLTVSYSEDTAKGSYMPSRIDYTGNANSSPAVVPSLAVVFVPSSTARLDVMTGYQGGAAFVSNQRLGKIQTYTGKSLVKEYRLDYAKQASAVDRSQLVAVTECDGGGVCLPSVAFTWTASGQGWEASKSQGNLHDVGDAGAWFVDVNGDGMADYVTKDKTGPIRWNLSTGTGWGPSQSQDGLQAAGDLGVWFVDINGDGMADYVTKNNNGSMYWSLSTGNGWAATQSQEGLPTGGYPKTWFVDINGDGLIDHIASSHWNLSNGNGWSPSRLRTDLSAPGNWFVDVNGDGMADNVRGNRFHAFSSSYYYESYPISWVQFDGDGWTTRQLQTHLGCSFNGEEQFVDVNGDGLADYLVKHVGGAIQWDLATGNGWVSRRCQTNQHRIGAAGMWFIDINGDGMADYVTKNKDRFIHWHLFNGNGWGAPQSQGGLHGVGTAGIWFVDINGDGLVDYVTKNKDKTIHWNLNASKPMLLESVKTGSGAVLSITYETLSRSAGYTKDTGSNKAQYPKVDVQGPLYVVSKVEQSDGVGGVRAVQYSYGGLKAELGTGRGMLGFRWVKSVDQGTGIEDYTEYRQDFPHTGQVAKSETRLAGAGNAGLLKRVSNTHGCLNPATNAACVQAAGSRYFTHPSQSVEEAWDLNGAALPTVSSSYQYSQNPQWGDPTQITIGTSDGASQTTNNEYWPAQTGSGQWISGRLKRSTVTSTKP